METSTTYIITTWMSLIHIFMPFFTQPGGAIFLNLTIGWVLCTVRRTVTGMLPFADPLGEHAHDAYHRWLPDARWAIEDTFKNTQQYLGGQQPQTFKRQEPERAAALSLWLYSMIWLWYLKQKPGDRIFMVPPWNVTKTTPSFADAMAALRRSLWEDRIKCMFGNHAVHDKKFEYLLEALAPAA